MASLTEAVQTAAAQLGEMERPLVIADLDADGISGAAIMAIALERLGKEPRVEIVPHLSQNALDRIREEKAVIFVDIGATDYREVAEALPKSKLLIIDHHQPKEEHQLGLLNPATHGLDGSQDACSATLAFLLAQELNEENVDLTPLALVGIIADAQEKEGLTGPNKEVVELGIAEGYIEVEARLRLFGYERRPLLSMLIGSHDLKIPGVTGNKEGAMRLMEELGIPLEVRGRPTRYNNLTPEEKEDLFEIGRNRASKQPAVAPHYILPREHGMLKDARQFATLLNACGRLEKAEDGIAICKGDDRVQKEAWRVLKEYREILREAYEWQKTAEEVERGDNYIIINAGRRILPNLMGTVCSMITRGGDVREGTFVLGLARNMDGVTTKVSFRIAGYEGPDLNELLGRMMEGISGTSGGHAKAAGAVITTEDEEAFLERAREVLGNL